MRSLLPCLLTLLAVSTAGGQYREPSEYRQFEERFVSAGFLHRDFRPRTGNPVADSLAIRYDGLMPVAGFRQGPVDIVAGYMQYRLAGVKREAVILAASVAQDVPLTKRGGTALLLPVVLSTDFARSEANGPRRETFNIASLGVGTGLKVRSTGAAHDLWFGAVLMAHYSFEGPGTGSGFSPALIAEAAGLFPRALPFAGLAAGYRLRLQSWSMSAAKFDYRSLSHGPFIGIML